MNARGEGLPSRLYGDSIYCRFFDKAIGHIGNALLTTVHTAYSNLVNKLLDRNLEVMHSASYGFQIK